MKTITLDSLAANIRIEHSRASALARDALDHALKAGRLLIEAKTKLAHGEWLPWLETNCPEIKKRQVQRYIRLAEKVPVLSKASRETHLSIRGALALLSEPKPEPESQFREPSIERDGFELPDMQHEVTGFADRRWRGEEGLMVWIAPSLADGFYHVTLFDGESLEGSKKAIRRDAVLAMIDILLAHQNRKRDSFHWLCERCEPTQWNEQLFTSKEDYYRRALGIEYRRSASKETS